MPDWLPLAPILIPLTAALLAPLVDRLSTRLRNAFSLIAGALTFASVVALAPPVLAGQTLVYWMSGWTPRDGLAIGVSLTVDAWALLFALIVAGVGTLCLLYAFVYLRLETGRGSFYVLFLLLMAGLIGFAFSGDLFNQFVWLEVFSVSAFALTGFNYEDRMAIEAAFKYLITNSIAALFIALALALLYMQTGALNIAHVARAFEATPAGLAALGLLVGGYATKAALVPWHFWLPDAHTVAPSPVSAMFSGALINIGIYAVGRSLFTLAPGLVGGPLQTLLLVVAALSMLVGSWQMLQQQSIKRILAFSSVSQMGYALLGLAIGTPLALAATAMHLLHHALVKTALFMGAGMVTWRAGLHHLPNGGRLARQMPFTLAVFCLAGLSLSGMPFLSGFVSKTMLEEAASEAHVGWVGGVAVAASALTLAGMVRLVWRVFGPNTESPHRTAPVEARPPSRPVEEAPLLALLPMGLLVAASLAIGLLPRWPAEHLAWPAARSLSAASVYIASVLDPTALDTLTPPAVHVEPAPHPTDWRHWPAPLVVIAGGGLLAVLLLRPPGKIVSALARPVAALSSLLRRWHSGHVGDYALYTALGATLLMLALVTLARR